MVSVPDSGRRANLAVTQTGATTWVYCVHMAQSQMFAALAVLLIGVLIGIYIGRRQAIAAAQREARWNGLGR
jgi:uncharacterized membrane protein YfcA